MNLAQSNYSEMKLLKLSRMPCLSADIMLQNSQTASSYLYIIMWASISPFTDVTQNGEAVRLRKYPNFFKKSYRESEAFPNPA